MASTPVHVLAPSGRTLTLELYPENSDTIVNGAGDSLAEETNRHGLYITTVTEALTGLHYAVIVDGSGNVIADGMIDLSDTTDIQRVFDPTASDKNFERRQAAQRVISVVEHQRGAHTHQPIGKIFYVDPVNGNTHANGNRGGIDDPYDDIQDCHDNAVTDSNHDMIILLAGASGGATTHSTSATITLSKRYLFVRGPGRDFIITRTGNGDTIEVTADGVELSGFQLNTAATGNGNGIVVTSADFFRAAHLWINDTQGDAIEMTDCDNFVITHCTLQGSGQSGSGHGISVIAGGGQTGNYGRMCFNVINDVQGDGIQLDTTGGGTVDAPNIHNNVIQGCTDDGIDIVDSGVTDAFITDNRFGNNTGSDIEDAGTNTVNIFNTDLTGNGIADTVLNRSVTNTEATAPEHCLTTVILGILESSLAGGIWTIRETGGGTHLSKTVTSDNNADPITGVT